MRQMRSLGLGVILAGLGAWLATGLWAADRVVAAHYPPLMIEGGDSERPGLAVEIMEEAARRVGREIEITFLPFERAIHALQTEPATLMPSLFYGKKRDDVFQWLVEIDRAELRFGFLEGQVDDLEMARGLEAIAIERGTTSEVLLKGLGFDNLELVNAPSASAQMLATGRVGAWLLTQDLMQEVWDDLGLSPELQFGEIVHVVPIFLVGSLNLPDAIAGAYRAAVEEMITDGTVAAIKARY